MKRTLALILCLLFAFGSLCGCAKEEKDNGPVTTPDEQTTTPADTVNKTLSAEEAVQIYVDNSDVWEYESDNSKWCGYIFLDLDFDGVLELVRTVNVSLNKSENKYFRIDKATKTVYELSYPEGEQWDFDDISYPQLFRNNETGELKYMVCNNTNEGAVKGGLFLGEMTLTDNIINTKKLWAFEYESLEETLDGEYKYTYTSFDENGQANSIDEDAYNQTLVNYEEKNTNLNLAIKIVDHANTEYFYTELSETQLFDLLLEAYNTFSHK